MREQYRKCIEFTDKYGLTYPSKDAQGNTVFRRHTQAIEARNLATIIAQAGSGVRAGTIGTGDNWHEHGTQAVVTGGI
jgi:hypothetical protein